MIKIKYTCVVLISFYFGSCQSQTLNKYNLDFENYNSLMMLPDNWFEWGDYNIQADTITVHSGKYASKIKSNKKGNSFGCIAYKIPANYKGEFIRLEGYMKIKNVENGFSGLLLRIDGSNKILAGDNMESQNIQGTKDWQKYSISLPYPENSKTIYVGGILTGNGQAWFDDFILTIDGRNVQTLKEREKPVYKATLDKEFDLGSKIVFPKLNEQLINNLELLGKIWGFLKYNHPEVCKGNYNWDYELFRMLPKYLNIKSKQERDQFLLNWISKYGELDKCAECKETSSQAFLKPDLFWFNDFELNSQLIIELTNIYENRSQGEHFYIDIDYAGNPKFINEELYYNMSYKDKAFKLLALYRYWNMIHYFYPNKHLIDKNWNDVLKVNIPKFINTKNKLEYELACIELIGEINDTHATTSVGFNNVQNIRGNFYPPFSTQFIDNKLVVTDYYNPELKEISKLEIGDIITRINNKPVKFILDSISPYYPASNEAAKLRDISRDILRSNEKEISIDYISNDKKRQHLLPLYKENILNKNWHKWTGDKCYKVIEGDIGYLSLEFIKKEDIPVIKEAFKNTKGIVIDIRNYPSTFVPFTLGSYFVSTSTPFVKFTNFNLDNPGEFNFTDALDIPKGEETYKGRLIVLVNEITQSMAEYTAMAFKAGDNTTIVGSQTAGADGNVSSLYLPGGLLTRISGIGVYYPDGTETQRIGIIPDVEIKPTIEGIKNGKDELLEKAIEVIKKHE
ncbi:peptidase S41 [Seonamhaeicola sp. S2-3]|uniref:S41 family peptidase n=1 Tax=Seonamhaeicola sp. S2-3 TaxID=1936081 RepID=UPI000972B109|nr:S41 family peptidase [Seonamhaeicola sp. S2-3]APY10449.1 peptidase S41 [Seonamhaeicola sp. S2-3]